MKLETKVGVLFIASLALVITFAYFMGLLNPFTNSNTLNVMYNYAGGIEEGSPVRVMGIKVGKVKKITFDPSYKTPTGEEVKLKLVIQIDKKAWTSVRKDSKFFINLAGVIGEKFLEISPGTTTAGEFTSGDVVRGEDPPRVDQLISQGYGLAGKIIELIEKNEGTVTNTVAQIDRLLTNFNKTLVLFDKASKGPQGSHFVDNIVKISDDVAHLTGQLRSKKAEDSYEVLQRLLLRADKLDAPAIRKFLQEEGIKAKLF